MAHLRCAKGGARAEGAGGWGLTGNPACVFAERGDAFGEVAAGADAVAEFLLERFAALRVIGDLRR